MSAPDTNVACVALISPIFRFNERIMGMDPNTSITAKSVKLSVTISEKSNLLLQFIERIYNQYYMNAIKRTYLRI